jgi:hypothetical protein
MNTPVFRFNAVGGRERASSRLRVWMLAEFLAKQGFETHVNGGSRFDILVCQKTYPFLLARNARRAGKTVLFDLDDPDFDLSPRWMDKIRRFMQLAHAVTTGSDYLKEKLEQFHPTAHVLENPVDVTDPQVFYKGTPWRGKSVWFGAPENLWMLRRLKLRHPVQTLTKGGDIPYKLKTVDRELCGFNLALLPVFLNEETLAKNANRLVKCAAWACRFWPATRRNTAKRFIGSECPKIFSYGKIKIGMKKLNPWRGITKNGNTPLTPAARALGTVTAPNGCFPTG